MADVKWIKIVTDIFDNRKIRQIESMPDGDTILVIWFKLICLAGTINDNGFVYVTQDIPYTNEMLANQFNRPLATVRLALTIFEQFGMIEIVDNMLCLSSWEKYQSVEKLEKLREQTRKRVAKWREKQLPPPKDECNVTCNANVTQCNATDIDKNKNRLDIDIDNKNILSGNPTVNPPKESVSSEFIKDVIEYLNEKAGTKYQYTSKKTQELIRARMNDLRNLTLDDFKTVIDNQVKEWKNDNKMAKYLRPETLFSNKFESYLNKPKSNGIVTDSYGRQFCAPEQEDILPF